MQLSADSVLVINTRRIGDALLTTPLIRSLRRAWPQARIDVLTFEGSDGFLRDNPDVDRVITVPERPRFWSHLRLLRRLRRRYDVAVSTLTGDRPTFYAWIAGRYRVGPLEDTPKQRWKQRLLSAWTPFDNTHTHTVQMNLRLAGLLGIAAQAEVVVAWGPDDARGVDAALPFDVDTQPYALLHLYPKFPYKNWHQEGWVALGRWLAGRGLRVVLTGGPGEDEQRYTLEVAAALSEAVNLTGRLSLAQNTYLASRARLYVGLDTALTHMAAAAGVPVVTLFGPSNPVKWGPWPRGYTGTDSPHAMRGSHRVGNVWLLQGEGECVPCFQEGCERHIQSLSACLQQLPAQRVIDAAAQMLDGR
jgi:heptosyltransferase-3